MAKQILFGEEARKALQVNEIKQYRKNNTWSQGPCWF